jgi:hypothetical protein
MSHRRAAVGAWGLCALTLAVLIVAGVLYLGVVGEDWAALLPQANPPSEGAGFAVLEFAWVTALLVVGATVASHLPRNPVGWFLLLMPGFMVFDYFGEAVYWHAAADRPRHPGSVAELGLWLGNSWWVPAVIVVFVFLPLLFPTGRPPTPRWRVVAWVAGAGGLVLFVGTAFKAGPLDSYPWVVNPLGVESMPDIVGWLGLGLWAATSLAAAASVVVRFRRSRGVERQQLKWFTAAAFLLVAMFLLGAALTPVLGDAGGWAITTAGFLGVAVAVAMGILRHRLYDIDVVINRALVYGGLTATLGGTYLGTVLLIGLAVGRSGLAVAASTLAVAALFRPARSRIQALVDRRFYRRRYDAQRTLEAFAARLRDEVALEALDSELRGVVHSTMQPAHVSLWLRGP